ncbi:hypothetical protein JMUB5695_01224 [Mycobacterium heckeshornense]|uniref:Uncharacterized protein n=2 Tax=Mycobacterium heckeshornense TaxID=110505 RepID=A0A7R7YQC6_9MYCO|nr:hypothetical protein MHEC_10780 [Mycobacterium heckeshornense]BCQ07801.1 hypothetical protein JMUB5695_01224 [Mycobacterium heckeshornense]
MRITPANIKRVTRDLPRGYEVTGLAAATVPAAIWGLGAHWAAHPAQCATLADPLQGRGESGQGVSGSGSGGIVYAVVTTLPAQSAPTEHPIMSQCRQWIMATHHAATRVRLVDPPHIDGIQTVGMASETTTSVEGGSEIAFYARTFAAYLGDYYAFTVLVTDPGSAYSPLPPQFAADLLVKTVGALRG